ncbi:hypothetical protein GCM10010409_01390 [Mycolicibacterium diernhoferi]
MVAWGSGGSRSPRPNNTLPRANNTAPTRISTTRYSNINVTLSILPYRSDIGISQTPCSSAPEGSGRRRYRGGRNVFIGGRSASDTDEVRAV